MIIFKDYILDARRQHPDGLQVRFLCGGCQGYVFYRQLKPVDVCPHCGYWLKVQRELIKKRRNRALWQQQKQ